MHLGLIGKSLKHSFSKNYFERKFTHLSLQAYQYQNYELEEVSEFSSLIKRIPNLAGLNVTIPYKTAIIPHLDRISSEAKEIEAVNTIAIRNGITYGFNTDHLGFRRSLMPLLKTRDYQALILGSGGASKAVQYALQNLGIPFVMVSTRSKPDAISYEEAGELLGRYSLVINCTPVGTWPQEQEMPALSLAHVSENHLFYDLIYNPEKTRLLQEAEMRGARVKNGYEMLKLQAEESWKIWHMDFN